MTLIFWGNDGAASGGQSREVMAPPLYESETRCSASGAAAEARTVEAERLATAKRKRYPFDGHDGLASLPLFQEASACFRNAGRIQDAQRASGEFTSFERKLSEDYAALQLQLRTARSARQYSEALHVTRDLEALISGRPNDAYSEWLADVHRELERKLAQPR
jgi:hypothetical protein